MNRNRWKNIRGVTLVEVLLSLVVLLIVMMGLMQTALLSIESNTTNQFRDAAVNIAAEEISGARSMTFDDLKNQTFLDRESGDNFPLAVCDSDPNIQAFKASDPCVGRNKAGPYEKRERAIRNITQEFGVYTCIDPPVPVDTATIKVVVRHMFRNECFEHSVTTLRRR